MQEQFVVNTLKCKKLNKSLWIYNMVYCMKIPILRDPNTVNAKFRWVGEDTTLYLLDHMNAFTLEHVLLWKEGTDTYAKHDEDIRE